MKGLDNNPHFRKFQELCEKQAKMEESLEDGNLSKEEAKKLKFDIKANQKGIDRTRAKLSGH